MKMQTCFKHHLLYNPHIHTDFFILDTLLRVKPLNIVFYSQLPWPDWMQEKFHDDFCGICNVPLSSGLVADSHYLGKKHIKRCNTLYVRDKPQDNTAQVYTADFHTRAPKHWWMGAAPICTLAPTRVYHHQIQKTMVYLFVKKSRVPSSQNTCQLWPSIPLLVIISEESPVYIYI